MSIHAGQQLRHLREGLKLTLRDVESASAEIAARRSNPEFFIPFSRLAEIETKGLIPTIHRIYSLAAIYRHDYRTIFRLYGVDLGTLAADMVVSPIPITHPMNAKPDPETLSLPVTLDPAFDLRRTMNVSRMIQKWGTVPLQFIQDAKNGRRTYGFIGTEDFTMFPLLMPGSFLQLDESRTEILRQGWTTEYERPIYFLETREEYLCSWCNVTEGDQIVIQPHPLSPVAPRIFRRSHAEIIGQVVGVAMRLGDWSPDSARGKKGQEQLN